MDVLSFLFWISFTILFFCYAGYGILLYIGNTVRSFFKARKPGSPCQALPVTLVIAAFNEEDVLPQKLRNTLAIDYPRDKLEIIFITDGSTDRSAAIIEACPSVTLLHQSVRKGKAAAIKRAMQFVQTPVVIFSDANTLLNKECIWQLLAHYADPNTGGVAGEKKIMSLNDSEMVGVGEGEGLYWQYESFMKKQDAGFYTVVGAAGELFSIRRSLFRELPDDLLLDDFVLSMQVCLQGYKIAYEPRAFAVESPSASLKEEEKRKVRIAAGAYQSIGYLQSCLKIFRHPLLAFQYISRRFLRWVCCPLLLVVLFTVNILLVYKDAATGYYAMVLYFQLLFYSAALIGWRLISTGKKAGLLTIPFYFVFMNYCLIKGFFKFIKGRQSVLWEKSLRQGVVSSQ
jgi:cellulose synthase/poly-beta-1,6-N-acetylglucosamine synthase-like glycosyltransferase